MAITNAIMQMRRGNEADFDPDKMHPGEWAVSTDKKYVRMCFFPGVCVRMATYDAFETDMAKIEAILSEVETIEEAVIRINEEVSENADAVVEYTEQAKQYRDEAKQFRDEAFYATPDGYADLVQNVSDNTVKIDAIIEKAELNIKNTATGENIHLTDSADAKVVEFGLYGKAEQKQYSGKNQLENKVTSTTVTAYGLTFVRNEDKSVTVNGTSTENVSYNVDEEFMFKAGQKYLLSGCIGGSSTTYSLNVFGNKQNINGDTELNTYAEDTAQRVFIYVLSGTTMNNITFYPMISIDGGEYEPYVGGIASPNPDYPQEITVAGSDGSVEVVSCGKNLVTGEYINLYPNVGLIEYNAIVQASVIKVKPETTYLLGKNGGSIYSKIGLLKDYPILGGEVIRTISMNEKTRQSVTTTEDTEYILYYSHFVDNPATDIFCYETTETDAEFEPRTETTATIPTPNGLAGIPVSSGGNYTDEKGQQWLSDEIIKYADGSGKRIQRIGQAVFDGSNDEGWTYNEQYFYSDIISSSNADEKTNFMCNRFEVVDVNTSIMTRDNTIGLRTDFVAINYSSITNISDFKAWLASNNVTVLYKLAEPIITDLTAEEIAEIEKLHTFYPVTNISNDADCGMAVTYLADAKNYIDNRLALIESAMLNNI